MRAAATSLLLICVVGLVSCNSLLSPSRSKRQVEALEGTRKLVAELAQNLQKAGQQAAEAIGNFTTGMQGQLRAFRQRVSNDIDGMRARVRQAVDSVSSKLGDSGIAVRNCVQARRQEADDLFNSTLAGAFNCPGERVDAIAALINDFANVSRTALDTAESAVEQMRNCTSDTNPLTASACLGVVAVQTEFREASLLARSGFLIARINFSLASLPTTLELCAASKLFEAGARSAQISMEVGTCSAQSIYSIFSPKFLY